MKRFYRCYLMLFVGFLATTCQKDNGNYDYMDLTTDFVVMESMPPSVVAKQNETITVNPTYANASVGQSFRYEWALVTTSPVPDPASGEFYEKQLGTDGKLTYRVVDPPGDYLLVLKVSDAANGNITQLIKIPFHVSSYASGGWMVLHGTSDSSDISILVNPKVNIQAGDLDFVQTDVFSETNGSKIPGEAAGIDYMSHHWVNVYTKGNHGGYRVSGDDLRVLNTYSEMFIEPLPESQITFQAAGMWSFNQLLINGGDLYFTPQPGANQYTQFGVKCFGEDYVAAPYIGTLFTWAYYGIIYDAQHQRFLYIDYNRIVRQFMPPGANAAFDMRNVGLDMFYAEHGFDSRWHCVMQDGTNTSSRTLLICKFDVMDDGNRSVARHDLSGASGLDESVCFAFGHRGQVMYHATPTHLYQNNYAGDRTSTLRLDVAANYPGYTVTALKVFKVNGHPSDGKLLFVALYNATEDEGILLQCDVNEVTGDILHIQPYSGFGKIGAMGFKTR